MEIQNIWKNLNNELKEFIFSRIKDEDITNDILQDIFLKIHVNIDTVKDKTKITSWIYQITRNAITDYHRKSVHHADIDEIDILETDIENHNAEFQKCLIPFINQLPDKYKNALFLVEIQGISQKEFAEKTGISYSAAKTRVQRAREKLKIIFVDCCNIQSDIYGNIVNYETKNNYCK